MTDQEVEKMLSVTFCRLGLDARAVFYANYLWWSEGEQKADEWIRRYLSGGNSPWRPPSLDQTQVSREAEGEMGRFYRREINVEFTRVEKNYWLNHALATADAQRALLTQMLEIAGFPARSVQFVELEQEAFVMIGERERQVYLAFLQSQAMSKQMEKRLEGDGAEPTATGATIAKAESDANLI